MTDAYERDDTGYSETTAPEHAHDCRCGTWLCTDETCEPDGLHPFNYGWRLCPYCEHEVWRP